PRLSGVTPHHALEKRAGGPVGPYRLLPPHQIRLQSGNAAVRRGQSRGVFRHIRMVLHQRLTELKGPTVSGTRLAMQPEPSADASYANISQGQISTLFRRVARLPRELFIACQGEFQELLLLGS